MKREEIVKELERAKAAYNYNAFAALTEAIEILTQKPEQKKGKWIVTGTFDDFLKCSCCGYRKPWNQDIFNFCPKCGAEMDER